MKEQLSAILTDAKNQVASSRNETEIEAIRVKYLGKKGELTELLRSMGSLSPEERAKSLLSIMTLEEKVAQMDIIRGVEFSTKPHKLYHCAVEVDSEINEEKLKETLGEMDGNIMSFEYEFDENGRPIIKSIAHGATYYINKGERFAQMRLVEVPTANFLQVESVGEIGDDRGGGFGSSGKN